MSLEFYYELWYFAKNFVRISVGESIFPYVIRVCAVFVELQTLSCPLPVSHVLSY